MADNLVIVESPAKARTIKKYLGKDFEVLASYGHVRDLVPKEGAVDPDDGFAMKYQLVERNERHVDAIAKALKKAKSLHLATDPDREGEAIAWHLYEILKLRGELKHKDVHRVVFHEITKNAVREAVAAPRDLSPPVYAAGRLYVAPTDGEQPAPSVVAAAIVSVSTDGCVSVVGIQLGTVLPLSSI